MSAAGAVVGVGRGSADGTLGPLCAGAHSWR